MKGGNSISLITRYYRNNPNKVSPENPSIKPTVEVLEELFEKFNEKFFESELSKTVITLSEEGRRKAYGWFITETWMDDKKAKLNEINICPEHLNRPIEEVCATLLHEMVHLKCYQDGKQDCSRSGQYHNKTFKLYAEKHGLNVLKTANYGWAATSLKTETLEFIQALDLKAFELFRNLHFSSDGVESGDEVENDSGGTTKPSSSRRYVCPECGLIIRATKEARIRCEKCDKLFIKKAKA